MRDAPTITPDIKQNIQSIAQLEQQFQRHRSTVDRLIATVSGFVGSVRFVSAHAVLFGLWIAANFVLPEEWRFDPSSNLLGVVAAIEALFLSAFVLMSQNRQGRLVEHWAHVTLQIGLLTEQEITKMLQLQQKLCDSLGLRREAADTQLREMIKPTDVEALVTEVCKAREVEDILIAVEGAAIQAKEDRVEGQPPSADKAQ